MKHLKYFENNKNLNVINGDYVLMKYKAHNYHNDVYIINNIDNGFYLLSDPLDSSHNGWYIEDDILKKATHDDIQRLKIELDAKKYNL